MYNLHPLTVEELTERSSKLETWALSRRDWTRERAVYGMEASLKDNDGSVVTLVDKGNDDSFYTDFADIHYPGEVVISEEGDVKPEGSSALNWLVDPIDGTANLKRNANGYTSICAALAENGRLVIAQVYDWTNDVLYKAIKGRGAFVSVGCIDGTRKERKLDISKVSVPKFVDFERCHTAMFDSEGAMEYLHSIGCETRNVSASSMTSMHMINGHNAAVVSTSEWSWDHIASLIVSEAGGIATDLYGNDLQLDKPVGKGMLVALNPKVHVVMLDALHNQGSFIERTTEQIQEIKMRNPF